MIRHETIPPNGKIKFAGFFGKNIKNNLYKRVVSKERPFCIRANRYKLPVAAPVIEIGQSQFAPAWHGIQTAAKVVWRT
jgi:hypothetical protein